MAPFSVYLSSLGYHYPSRSVVTDAFYWLLIGCSLVYIMFDSWIFLLLWMCLDWSLGKVSILVEIS